MAPPTQCPTSHRKSIRSVKDTLRKEVLTCFSFCSKKISSLKLLVVERRYFPQRRKKTGYLVSVNSGGDVHHHIGWSFQFDRCLLRRISMCVSVDLIWGMREEEERVCYDNDERHLDFGLDLDKMLKFVRGSEQECCGFSVSSYQLSDCSHFCSI